VHLTDAASPANLALFQYQWARGQPILISNSNRYLEWRLWHPRTLLKDFGHLRSVLVNTLTGKNNEGFRIRVRIQEAKNDKQK
jgi:lysine-specific demethylase 3